MTDTPTVLDTHEITFRVLRANGWKVGTVRKDGTVRAHRTITSLSRSWNGHIEIIARPDGQAYITVRRGLKGDGGMIYQGTDRGEATTDTVPEVAVSAIATVVKLA